MKHFLLELLRRPNIVENKPNVKSCVFAGLFTSGSPLHSFPLSTAVSLTRQASYNQPLTWGAESQLCSIWLLNFFFLFDWSWFMMAIWHAISLPCYKCFRNYPHTYKAEGSSQSIIILVQLTWLFFHLYLN